MRNHIYQIYSSGAALAVKFQSSIQKDLLDEQIVSILREESVKCLNGTFSGYSQLLGFGSDLNETRPLPTEYKIHHIALRIVVSRLSEYSVNYISTNSDY